MYLDTMEEMFGKTPKVLLDVSENAPLMYLPLDQLSSGSRNRSNASGGSADGNEQLDPNVIDRLRNTQGSTSSSSNSNSSSIRREGR